MTSAQEIRRDALHAAIGLYEFQEVDGKRTDEEEEEVVSSILATADVFALWIEEGPSGFELEGDDDVD